MAFIEFQVSSSSFLALQQVTLQQQAICTKATMTFAGVEFRVDHVEFGANSFRHTVPYTANIVYLEFDERRGTPADALRTQIAQRVTIFVDSTADILAHPNATPPGIFGIGMTVVFDVAYYPIDAQCYLIFGVSSIEFDPIPGLPPGVDVNDVKTQLTAFLLAQLPSPAINFDFANVLTGASVTVQNADVSIGGNGAFIAFRAQLGDLQPAVASAVWSQFLQGNIADRRAGADWALFFPTTYFEQYFEITAEQRLGNSTSFDLISGGSDYYNDSGKVRMVSTIDGNVNLPDPTTTKYVSVIVTSILSMASPNTIQIDITVPSADELVDGFLGAFAGVLKMLGPLGNSLHGLAKDAIAGKIPGPKDSSCTKVSETQYKCMQTFVPPTLPSGAPIRVTSLVGLDDGISFGGVMKPVPLTPPVISSSVREYKFLPPKINCASAGPEIVAAVANDPQDFASAHGTVFLDNAGSTPVTVCSLEVRNDTANAFPLSAITVEPGLLPLSIVINAPVPNPAYYAAPYTCDLLITTTGGVRLVRLMPAPVLTQDEIDKLVAETLAALVGCEQLVDPWGRTHAGFNPHWLVDPPIDRVVEHIWEFTVSNLSGGDTIELVDASGREQMRAVAHAGQTMYLSARLAPAGEKEVTLFRAPSNALSVRSLSIGSNLRPRLAVGQQMLIRVGVIPLQFSCRDLAFAPLFSRRCAAVTLANTVELYDFSNAFRPQFVRSWSLPGVRGTLALGRRAIAFGDEGFFELTESGRPIAVGSSCGCGCGSRILDAAARSGFVYALNEKALEVYDSRLCRVAEIPVPIGKAGAVFSDVDRLFVSGEQGLRLYDLSDRANPAEIGFTDAVKAVKLGTMPVATRNAVVAGLENGSAVHVEFVNGNLRELAAFREAPWFLDSLRIGRTLVSVNAQRGYLDVAVLGISSGI